MTGQLNRDNEGFLVLTNDGVLQVWLAQPGERTGKIYYIQARDEPTAEALGALRNGVTLNDGPTPPAGIEVIEELVWLWLRNPPTRGQKNIPTSWLKVTLYEGRNHQVCRITVHAGFPTLHPIRYAMGDYASENLANGEQRELESQPYGLT